MKYDTFLKVANKILDKHTLVKENYLRANQQLLCNLRVKKSYYD